MGIKLCKGSEENLRIEDYLEEIQEIDKFGFVELFVEKVRFMQKFLKISDYEMKLIVVSKFRGKIYEWFVSNPSHCEWELAKLLEELSTTFSFRSLLAHFELRHWDKKESFMDYYDAKLMEGIQLNLNDEVIVESIVRGLAPANPELYKLAREEKFTNPLELLNFVENFERAKKEKASKRPFVPPFYNNPLSFVGGRGSCLNCGHLGHKRQRCPVKEQRPAGSCYICWRVACRTEKCPRLKAAQMKKISKMIEASQINGMLGN